jgi:hypothetical protein
MTDGTLQPSNPRIVVGINRILLAVALVILLFYFAVYVVYAANLIQFPYDYDQGEGFELVDVMRFSDFQFPYADIETYPFYGSIYPPLYHILLVPFHWIFGPEYWYGRLFSFVSALVSASVIGYAIYRESGGTKTSRMIALLSGLAFLASTIVYHIGPLFRQHISMVMFESLAIVVLAHASEIDDPRQRRRRLLLGFALLLAAGYTKQLAAFTALAAIIFLFIRNPRRALAWGIGFAAVALAIFAALTVLTDGHWWTQTVLANVKDFSLDQARGLFKVFIKMHFWLLIPAGLFVIYETYFDRLSIYSIWFIVTIGLNGYSAGTWGAGDSYYATPIAATCVLSGIFIARTINHNWRFNANYLSRLFVDPVRRFTPVIASAGLIIVPLFYIGYAHNTLHMPTTGAVFEQIADALNIDDNTGFNFHDPDGYLTYAYAQIGHLLTDSDVAGGDAIVALIREIPADQLVLSEEAAFSLATDRDVITNPVVLKILWEAGEFDSANLINLIENQAFGLIILRAQFFPEDVNRAITQYYETDTTIAMNGFDYIIKRPRNQPLP